MRSAVHSRVALLQMQAAAVTNEASVESFIFELQFKVQAFFIKHNRSRQVGYVQNRRDMTQQLARSLNAF